MQLKSTVQNAERADDIMQEKDYVATPDGRRLFIRDWRTGPAVLFLAGWAMHADLWGQVMLRLTDRGFRAIAYDRRGHGRSSDSGGMDYDGLADDLDAVMEARALQDCIVVAHSGAAGEVIRCITRHGAAHGLMITHSTRLADDIAAQAHL